MSTSGKVKTGWVGSVLPYLYRMSLDNSAEFYIHTLELVDDKVINKELKPLLGDTNASRLSITTLASLKTDIQQPEREGLKDSNILRILVKSVKIDNIQFQDIKEWIGSAWAYTTGVHELQQVSITFRDINGGTLYTNFKKFLELSKNLYPNQQKWKMVVKKTSFHGTRWGDYEKSSMKDDSLGNSVVDTQHAILRGLSGLDLDADNSSINTFTAEFLLDPFPFMATGETTKSFGQ